MWAIFGAVLQWRIYRKCFVLTCIEENLHLTLLWPICFLLVNRFSWPIFRPIKSRFMYLYDLEWTPPEIAPEVKKKLRHDAGLSFQRSIEGQRLIERGSATWSSFAVAGTDGVSPLSILARWNTVSDRVSKLIRGQTDIFGQVIGPDNGRFLWANRISGKNF